MDKSHNWSFHEAEKTSFIRQANKLKFQNCFAIFANLQELIEMASSTYSNKARVLKAKENEIKHITNAKLH
jgi:hypothetical protein